MQLTEFSIFEIFHTPGKNSFSADTPNRGFKIELQLNQLKLIRNEIDFAFLKKSFIQLVHH